MSEVTSTSGPWSVVEAQRWRRDDGATASVYGACPWTTDAERARWTHEVVGWTVADSRSGTIGCGRPASATREEAQSMADAFNARIAEAAAAHRLAWPESYLPKAPKARRARKGGAA